eukprot:8159757-Alexandrium_andersonii.AAC.1
MVRRLQLIDGYMSIPGGRLSAKKVEQMWRALEKPKEDSWGLRGPEESPLRFWAKQEESVTWSA